MSSLDKLNPYSPQGKKIIYHGEVIEQYWEDISLLARYRNGGEFINDISRRYKGYRTKRNWQGKWEETTMEKVNEAEADFRSWLREQLKHKELRACYENSNDSTIREIKGWLPSGP